MKIFYKIIAIFILLPFYSRANHGGERFPHSKEKTITEIFNTNADVTTQINTSYGAIHVFLWDENKVSINVNIKVSGKNQQTVNEKLEKTTVDFSSNPATVSAKTVFDSSSWNWTGTNVQYEINYTIKIPRRSHVDLKNNYGSIAIEKLMGNSLIKSAYSKLNFGELQGNNVMSLSYVEMAKFDAVNDLSLQAQYSDIHINKGDKVTLKGNYNDYLLNQIQKLTTSSNYDDINAKNIENFTCNGNYVDLNLGDIDQCTLSLNYAEVNFNTNNSFRNATITANYTSFKINTPADLAFDFDIRCSYGSLKSNLDLDYSLQATKNNSKQYKGFRNASGKSKFTIITNYGSVQINNKQK